MTFAMALSVAALGVVIAECAYGAGKHIGDVHPDVYMIGNKLNFITQPMYLIDICVVKLAVGASLLRIASTKFYRTLILSVMGFMAFYTTGCFFVSGTGNATIPLSRTPLMTDWLNRPSFSSAPTSACCGIKQCTAHAGLSIRSKVSHTPTWPST
jgi:hypothetical protein